jgi:8-oxo-dGTP pyrophosphatase MutT (NUDIX family)
VLVLLPEPAVVRARAVADGREPASPLRPAATVVLLRDGVAGVEAYLQRRHTSLAFAGGMHAFPGGRVDAADGAAIPTWWGPPPAAWGERFGTDAGSAAAHVVGVTRELFEETGVLLAAPREDGATWPSEADRVAVAAGHLPLADLLHRHRLALDCRDLRGWSVWVTPRFETRRFEAWFFVVRLPAGQAPRVASGESHDGCWVAPSQAALDAQARRLAMLPPTWWTLRELAGAATVEEVLADPPALSRHTAGWVPHGGGARMVLPGDPDYPGADPAEGR